MAFRGMFVMNLRRYTSVQGQRLYHKHRLSNIFKPLNVLPKDAVVKSDESMSASQRLLVDMGLINLRNSGMYAMLPLGQRVVAKLTSLIDEEMVRVGAQRISLPHLTSATLWRTTGRWESSGPELLTVQDRHYKDYVLSPTHEEAIASLMSDVHQLSYKDLPLRLYQVTTKFRDEMKPRFGLLRCREFLMKDLYTFDKAKEEAVSTYNEICGAYNRIFQRIGVPFIKVAGDCGNIGGDFSHEYHYQAAVGEDTLLLCQGCGDASNAELLPDTDPASSCSRCGGQVSKVPGIEVGHTFLLGTKYSKPLQASYRNIQGKPEALWMGCYGVGVSRVVAAVVEVLAHEDNIIWPPSLVPYKVCIIGPKRGSLEESVATWVEEVASAVGGLEGYRDDVVVDDRDHLTIGRRVLEAKRTGFPTIVVVGKRAAENVPLFELINTTMGHTHFLSHIALLQWLTEAVRNQ